MLRNFRLVSTSPLLALSMSMQIIQPYQRTLASPPLTSYKTPTLPNYTLVSQKHSLIPFLLLCSRLLTSHSPSVTSTPLTLDYHIRNSLHQLHVDPLVDPLPRMVTLPHKSREHVYRNILRTTLEPLTNGPSQPSPSAPAPH